MPNAEEFRALIARLGDGTEEAEKAARQIIDEFGDQLRAVICRRLHPRLRSLFDTEDFMQSVWTSLVRLGPKMSEVDDFEHLTAFLVTLARNKIKDAVKYRVKSRANRTPPHANPLQTTKELLERPDKLPNPKCLPRASELAAARERWRMMLDGETLLARQVLTMRMAGNTNDAIAQELNIHVRTVQRILSRIGKLDAEKFGSAG